MAVNPFYVQVIYKWYFARRWVVYWGGNIVSPEFIDERDALRRADALYEKLKLYQ